MNRPALVALLGLALLTVRAAIQLINPTCVDTPPADCAHLLSPSSGVSFLVGASGAALFLGGGFAWWRGRAAPAGRR